MALLRQRLPQSQVVLLGLLPRGSGTAEGLPVWDNDHSWPSVYTEAMTAVNEQLRWARERGAAPGGVRPFLRAWEAGPAG